MGSALFHVGAQAICPHAGQISTVSTNTRVTVGGQPVATAGDQFLVAGCAFSLPPPKGPQPCVTLQWLQTAVRVRVSGQFVILATGTALCKSGDQIPQGPPSILVTQQRVTGT
jgi:hypothetical protein